MRRGIIHILLLRECDLGCSLYVSNVNFVCKNSVKKTSYRQFLFRMKEGDMVGESKGVVRLLVRCRSSMHSAFKV